MRMKVCMKNAFRTMFFAFLDIVYQVRGVCGVAVRFAPWFFRIIALQNNAHSGRFACVIHMCLQWQVPNPS